MTNGFKVKDVLWNKTDECVPEPLHLCLVYVVEVGKTRGGFYFGAMSQNKWYYSGGFHECPERDLYHVSHWAYVNDPNE